MCWIPKIAQIAAFYVSANNSLACAQFIGGTWIGSQGISPPYEFKNISQFTVAPRSRHLSISVAPGRSELNIFLFYESTNNEIVLLNGSLTFVQSFDLDQVVWMKKL